MDTSALISSATRPLRLRRRGDLTAQRHRYLGRSYWVVKEPISLKYFRFQEEEYDVLNLLDGKRSLAEVKEAFEAQHPPQKVTLADVHQFVSQLHRSGLVISEAPKQGKSLYTRSSEVKRREWMQRLSSVLAMRFKGIDPEWILNRGYPFVAWLFHPAMVIFCVLMALAALLLVTVQFDSFSQRLPTFHEFFGPKNWLLLAIVLGVTKVLHEFGHGFSCKHFGGECHEMGVMLLVLTPCLYCNVSDSWLLRNKWHRAAIGAAGIYVELLLASAATFIWWFTQPDTLINLVALQVMFVCSISTILFNGNPLLRYDGYYILSDILEIPNLRQKASQVLGRLASKWCLGLELPENPFLPRNNQLLFASYTIASTIYRWVVVFSILFFLNKVFEPYGLKVLGQIIMLFGLFGLVVMPLYKIVKFLRVPGRLDQVKRKNVLITAGVAAAVLAFVLLVPLPCSVKCAVELRPRDSRLVYVKVPGVIAPDGIHREFGKPVEADAPLLTLVNHDLSLSLTDLQGRIAQQETVIAGMETQRAVAPAGVGDLPAARESLQALREQLREKQSDAGQLTIRAPISGTLLPPPSRPHQPPSDGRLPEWEGTPFDEKNTGAYLDESVQIGEIADPTQMEAVVIVDQGDVELVTIDQKVRIKLDAYTGEVLQGHIKNIAENELEIAPAALSQQAGGALATKTDPSGVQRPLHTSYVALVPIENADLRLRSGMRGRAKIKVAPRTLGQRLGRLVMRTVRFEL
mgnify:CR=1 FL=1